MIAAGEDDAQAQDIAGAGTAFRQDRHKILEGLHRLGLEIPAAHDLAILVEPDLARDEEQFARGHHAMAVGAGGMDRGGAEEMRCGHGCVSL